MQDGIVNLNKPSGITSFSAVARIRRIFGVKKAGHCGTLDPMATGVLPVMIGNAVKASEYLTDHDKRYIAKIKFGIETDTEDITGNVVSEYDGLLPSLSDLNGVLSDFSGKIMQVPPMYSALKVGGKKLVDLARNGVEVERCAREIEVYSISAYEDGDGVYLNAVCSKGTYIRTLCADIGRSLGCGAVMESLCRDSVGAVVNGVYRERFLRDNSVTFEDLESADELKLSSLVIPTDDIFDGYAKISLPPFFERLFKNGAEVYINKLDFSVDESEIMYRVYDGNGFFAVGELLDYPDGKAIKMKKMFVTEN